MEYVSIFEARLRTGVSEVTIRRAIKSGKIAVKARALQPGEQYLIPVEELEKLKPRDDYALITQQLGNQKQRIDTLYELFAAHDFRIKELEEKLRTIQALPTVQTAQETRRETQETPVLPDGTLTISEFADALGIARKTLLDAVMKYDLDHIAIPNPARPKEMKRYFTPEQQTAIKQWRASRQT